MKDKTLNIIVFIFITASLIFLSFNYFNLCERDSMLKVFEFLGNIWNFIGNHSVSFIGLIICVIVIVVLLRAHKFVIAQEINYRRILHEKEVEIAERNRKIQDLNYFNDQKAKSLEEMTVHYDNSQDIIKKLEYPPDRFIKAEQDQFKPRNRKERRHGRNPA